jgi:hypothetical protein
MVISSHWEKDILFGWCFIPAIATKFLNLLISRLEWGMKRAVRIKLRPTMLSPRISVCITDLSRNWPSDVHREDKNHSPLPSYVTLL